MGRGEQARRDILDAAEQLIAERGVQVPLRDIALAAGQRNNSAVNYYFRNRQELIDAIVLRRLEPMERERALMLAALGPDHEVAALLQVMVLPFTTVPSRYYARFLQAATLHLRADIDSAQGSVWRQVLGELARAIPTDDAAARRRRVSAVATAMFALLADLEHTTHDTDLPTGGPDEIVAMLAAMLTAPMPLRAVEPAVQRK
ncbi:TetR family transcriptional regulator [Mycolicibacterium sp. S2-37]|uniref:TetR/AcrR family transcriptional regulator n=1 Tax=Mycolicibacterium sp. S2-37 TaxID=2810297 RepID=UPI001A945D12|nr:TetR/AcrR family transcriptional regulator [Mycolicibacterium sp. S2-37]MBO0681277.1 TetR family transcriptional regulator [Mycolicibacterium sp. S2-37]